MRWLAECTTCCSSRETSNETTALIWADDHEALFPTHRVTVDHEPFED